MTVTAPTHLSDGELVSEVAHLAASERGATAALVAHLAELYGRRLHERAGFSSLFTYCMEVLHLSEHESYDRMKAAKVARRYPVVLESLAGGRVNLTTIRLLAPHLTRKNHEELLAAAAGRRKRQVQELLAERFPKPDVPSSVRKIPVRYAAPLTAPAATKVAAVSAETPALPVSSLLLIPPAPPQLVHPLAPDRYRISFTATKDVCEKLELAQDLLRDAVPDGDAARIFERALDVLIERLVKEKYATTSRPRASRGQADDSRNIPAEVKRAVYIRDRGRCVFVGTGGRRCGGRGFVEFHHAGVPYAAGGRATVENIELRCRAHNDYEAELFYGPGRRDAGASGAREAAVASGAKEVAACERVNDDAFRSGTTNPGLAPSVLPP